MIGPYTFNRRDNKLLSIGVRVSYDFDNFVYVFKSLDIATLLVGSSSNFLKIEAYC